MGSKHAPHGAEVALDKGGIARDDGNLLPTARGGAGKEIKCRRGRGGLSDVGAIHFGKREGARLQDRADAVLRGTPEHGGGAANPVAAGLPYAPVEGDLKLGMVRVQKGTFGLAESPRL